MKTKLLLEYLKIILFFLYISISREDLCPDNQISINALGTICLNIDDFLEKSNITIDSDKLLYLASNNQGKIEKNNYSLEIFKLDDEKLQSQNIQKSKIYISKKCMTSMEQDEKIKLDKSKGIVIIVYNSNKITINNLPDNYFIIRQDNKDAKIKYMNSKYSNFSLCHEDPILLDNQINITELKYDLDYETPIDIDKIIYAKKLKIDLFDPHSEFLNNICFKFTSENKTDVTLDSRLEDYYQNITLCNESLSSHYIEFNYSSNDKILTYRCAYGFYENEEQQLSYIDAIDNKMKFLFSTSNLKIITCYDEFFNLRNSANNYGGAICVLVLLIQIILYINFCCKGTKPLEEKLEELFSSAHDPIKLKMEASQDKNNNIPATNNEGHTEDRLQSNNNENTVNDVKIINSEDQIKKENIEKKKKEKEQKEKDKIEKEKKEQQQEDKEDQQDENLNIKRKKKKKKSRKKSKKNTNPPKNRNKINEINQKKSNVELIVKDYDENEENEEKEENTQKGEDSVEVKKDSLIMEEKDEKDKENKNNNIRSKKRRTNNINENNKEKASEKGSKISQIYDLDNDEKNELTYERALRYDDRNFCKYYCFLLQIGHIILSVFCRCSDYNIFSVKLGLLFMMFPINLTANIFFFTSKNIKATYTNKIEDISMIYSNLLNTFVSSIFASILLILLKILCLTHNSIRSLRKIKDVEKARKKSKWMLRCIKIRITIYYFLSYIFLLIFGYYIGCFCAVFQNAQIELIKSMLTSWLMSLLYPFGIYFVASIFRRIAIRRKIKCFYKINQIFQMI